MLCERCERFDIQSFGRDPHPYRGVPFLEVIRSAGQCSFCSLLLENLKRAKPQLRVPKYMLAGQGPWEAFAERIGRPGRWPGLPGLADLAETPQWINFSVDKNSRNHMKKAEGLNISSINAFVESLDTAKDSDLVRFNLAADSGTPASISGDITGHLIIKNPWSIDSLELILAWHRECTLDHPKCSRNLSGTKTYDSQLAPLPTRLVEVLPTKLLEGESSWRYLLRETADKFDKYIILSHRWDEDTKRSKTTKANYLCRLGECGHQKIKDEQACSLEIDCLPRLFAETCKLAYDLGIKYVWIDSLCIKQDDEQDWEREAPRMAHYYQNAWITVAAANATVGGGLFDMRRTEFIPRVTRLPYVDTNENRKGYFYVQPARADLLRDEFNRHVENSVLRQRGWVYQEWMLSRRIIAFSDSGFFLHCHSSTPTASTSDRVSEDSEPDRDIWSENFMLRHAGLSSPKQVSAMWRKIVTNYSQLHLTYPDKDRLVALAGVASEIGRAIQRLEKHESNPGLIKTYQSLNRRYLCGLWLWNIHNELLWEQASPGCRWRIPGIPTWSWASLKSRCVQEDGAQSWTGLAVRWPMNLFGQSQNTSKILKATIIPVHDHSWLPRFDKPVAGVPEYEYGNAARFNVLMMQGCLQRVLLRGKLSEQDVDLARGLTSRSRSYRSLESYGREAPPGTGLWRVVCLPTCSDIIVGWASIEHPDLQSDETITSGGPILALFVQRYDQKGGLFQFNRNLVSRVGFTVLFLRKVSAPGFDNCYERVGAGCLFSARVDKAYQSLEQTTLSLI